MWRYVLCKTKTNRGTATIARLISATEAELDAEIHTEQVGAILVLASDVHVELARRDLARQSDRVLELVLAGRQWALEISIVGPGFLAHIKSSGEQSDEAELDNHVCESAVLLKGTKRVAIKSSISDLGFEMTMLGVRRWGL